MISTASARRAVRVVKSGSEKVTLPRTMMPCLILATLSGAAFLPPHVGRPSAMPKPSHSHKTEQSKS
jgi:hypothetical protein